MSMHHEVKNTLSIRHIKDIERRDERTQWLVRSLWTSGVGLVGGQPKQLKTYVATELAYAVATGHKALGRFEVERSGPVLGLFAEDDLLDIRTRFEQVAEARGGALEKIPVHLIDTPAFYLDQAEHLQALRTAVDKLKPRLLILDPFIRLVKTSHENSAAEVSAVLGTLREIQRTFDVAILLVHHMRKARAGHISQQLRGSGDFSAWSDSAIYITRQGDDRLLTVEHRCAAAPPPILVRLKPTPAPHLVVVDQQEAHSRTDSLQTIVLERLKSIARPQSTLALRNAVKVRKATLVAALHTLEQQGHITKTKAGWILSKEPVQEDMRKDCENEKQTP